MDSEFNGLKEESSKKSKYITNHQEKSFITNKCQVIIVILFFLFYVDTKIKNYKLQSSVEKIEKLVSEEQKLVEENKILKDQNFGLNKLIENTPSKNIEYLLKLLKLMTNNDKDKYKGAEYCLLNNNELCIYHLLCPKEVIGKKRILIGNNKNNKNDAHVLLDDFQNIKIAYSFGISSVNFEQDLANKGIDVYMYDNVVKSLPYKHNKFHWKKIVLGRENKKDGSIKTLEKLIKANGHTKEVNMILKIDKAFYKWNTIEDLSERILNQFKYIILELHFENDIQLYYNVLKKLSETHQVFYFNCNYGGNVITFGNNRVCEFLEVSYVIRKNNFFMKDTAIYPIPDLDIRNTSKSDINLNIFKLFDY